MSVLSRLNIDIGVNGMTLFQTKHFRNFRAAIESQADANPWGGAHEV